MAYPDDWEGYATEQEYLMAQKYYWWDIPGVREVEQKLSEADIESLRQAYIRHATYTGIDQEAARLSAEGYAAQLEAAGVPIPELAASYEMVAIPGYPDSYVAASTLPEGFVMGEYQPPGVAGMPAETSKEIVENGGAVAVAAKGDDYLYSVATKIVQSGEVTVGPGGEKIIPEKIFIEPSYTTINGGQAGPGISETGGWSELAKLAAAALILL